MDRSKTLESDMRTFFNEEIQPFWLKPLLTRGLPIALFLLCLCSIVLFSWCTVRDAEGMVESTCARWMGSDCEGATSKVGDVPRAKKHGNALPPGKPKSHSPQVQVRQPTRLPEQVAADAAEEVHRLEAAVQVLGERTISSWR